MSDAFLSALGSRLKALRAERRLTQAQLAKKAGCAASVIGEIETAKSNPTLAVLHLLARALGVTLRELLPEESITIADRASAYRPPLPRPVQKLADDIARKPETERRRYVAAIRSLIRTLERAG